MRIPALNELIEEHLTAVMTSAISPLTPPRLAEAMRYAVFPGGARLRPLLCLGVAHGCGAADMNRAVQSAVAIELVHCASLVHDDMACCDDADLRRGKVTVNKRYSESTALLVGDALLVLAFETLARAGATAELVVLTAATGASRGIIAGQAWESEPTPSIDDYHRAKTGALFEAAAALGAIAAKVDPQPWQAFGSAIGCAYQAADDLADALAGPASKTSGRDEALKRPSLVRNLGVEATRQRLQAQIEIAYGLMPSCPERAAVLAWLETFVVRAAGTRFQGAPELAASVNVG